MQSSHEKGKTLSLLKDVTGYFLPKQMAALVGHPGGLYTPLPGWNPSAAASGT